MDRYLRPYVLSNTACLLISLALFFIVVGINKSMQQTEQKVKVFVVLTNMSLLMLTNMTVTRQSFNGIYTLGYFLVICLVVSVVSCVKGSRFLTQKQIMTCK